ncbi:MAG: hypothetical protein ACYC91_05420 [Solirubrobacteraceae bacterium]
MSGLRFNERLADHDAAGLLVLHHGRGFPDPETFAAACADQAAFHDELWEHTGLDASRTVLAGFRWAP